MKLGIIGATGRAGSLILAEAEQRGHEVIALVRDRRKLTSATACIEKPVLELDRSDIQGLDVLVSAYGVPLGREHEHLDVTRHLLDILRGTSTRLIVVGSAGHLFTSPARTSRYYETELKPGPLRNGSAVLRQVTDMLAACPDVTWTYLAPAIEFQPNGPRTGTYRAGDDVVLCDAQGRSRISYADYAIALIDEVEQRRHLNQLFTVAV